MFRLLSRILGTRSEEGNRNAIERDQTNLKEDASQVPALFENPWRTYNDLKGQEWPKMYEETLKKTIANRKVKVNLIFVGQVQSGKSSTINSLLSIEENELTERAKAGESDKSLTIQFNVIHGENMLENVTFCDLMGLELAEGRGLSIEDIQNASEGCIVPGETLNPLKPQAKCEPIASLQSHCVVYIMDAENVSCGMSKDFKKKIAQIEEILKTGPNRVVIVTKVDKICPKVKEDIRTLFHSRKVYEAVTKASKLVGVSMNKVFPVQNYVDAVELDTFSNIPLLLALNSAIKMGSDYIKGQRLDNKIHNSTEK